MSFLLHKYRELSKNVILQGRVLFFFFLITTFILMMTIYLLKLIRFADWQMLLLTKCNLITLNWMKLAKSLIFCIKFKMKQNTIHARVNTRVIKMLKAIFQITALILKFLFNISKITIGNQVLWLKNRG